MNKINLFLLAAILCITVNAQPSLVWANAISGAAGNGTGYSIGADASGNVYSTGGFTGTVDFDPGPNTYSLHAIAEDIYIQKLDAQGNLVWAGQIGGNYSDVGRGIAVDAAGNSYICGQFAHNVDFDPGPGVSALFTPGNGFSAFILKLDPAGNFVWAKGLSSDANASVDAMAIAVDPAGNVYTTGYFGGTVDFDPGAGTYTLTDVGGSTYDMFVSKLDANGNFLWARRAGDNGQDLPSAIAVDASGNAFITGSYYLSPDFDPGAGVATLTAVGNEDIFVWKLNSSGNYVWAKSMGGPGHDGGSFIKIDPSGNVISGGYYSSNADFDPGPAVSSLSAFGIYISKLDASGGFVWVRYGNTTCNNGAIDASGNIYTAGAFGSSCIDKHDAGGNSVWTIGIGASGATNESAYAMCLGPNNAIYSTGSFTRTSDFDPGTGTYTIAPPNGYTPYINMLCQSAPPIYALQGNTLVCAGYHSTYSTAVTGASSYNWSLPNGWSGTSTTNTLDVTVGTGTVTISVHAGNACGSGTSNLTVYTKPAPTIGINSGSICAGGSFTLSPSGAASYTITGGNTVVTPATTTTYSITGTAPNGCISGTTAILTVNAIPLINLNGGFICLGDSFTLSPSGVATYTISGGNSVVSPTANSSYTVTGASSQGCFASPAIANIFVHPLPQVHATSNQTLICAGDVVTLNAAGADTYTWSTGAIGSPASDSPTATLTYTVRGTDDNGCINTATCSMQVATCTGFASLQNEAYATVFPNPATSELTIGFTNHVTNASVELYNALGQIVLKEPVESTVSQMIRIDSFSTGVYYLKVLSGNKIVLQQKIVKY